MRHWALGGWALFVGLGASVATADVTAARYSEPTDRYAHGVLGDAIEWGALEMISNGQTIIVRLPETRVFEDVAPRLVDIDLDGAAEAMVVETQIGQGARLAVYRGDGSLMAATPYIGRNFRWLAPVGAADMDGDGRVELAYVDRPHLAKTLRVWRYDGGELVEVASKPALTNHRIGEPDIAGGLRDCGDGVEMITVDAFWTSIVATRFENGGLTSREIGPHEGRASFEAALDCALP